MGDTMVIWAANIDSSRSRKMGRKLSKGLSLRSPDLKELSKAAHNLGLQSTREKEKLYPKDRSSLDEFPSSGRLTIDKRYPKIKTLKLLADEVRRIRKEKEGK
ncbi:MAG TPA: signal recognition particle subunit SRP19/SEC65 family protein [Candidatus Methanofastidiosa archaeon]|nr:signal recognition particle subunit SRP19/SEC65 family protein [Candidatus Methanofastidiosa archaeon]HPR41600.1 signal recognition particle subunit SRP19/SEC65 family protein [Candidatus Methanofastidiosa archaeon]